MAINERQNEILRTLKESKTASVNALAKALYVSEATIRRDLAEMKSMGLIERSHGGAILPENAEEISIFFRMEKTPTKRSVRPRRPCRTFRPSNLCLSTAPPPRSPWRSGWI